MNEHTLPDQIGQLTISYLLSLAKRDPAHIVAAIDAEMRRVERGPVSGLDSSTASWVKGVALFEMGRNSDAIVELTAAINASSGVKADKAAVSLAAAEAAGGDVAGAVDRLENLMDSGDPIVQALAGSQLGLIHLHRGELHRSLDLLEAAAPTLGLADDQQAALSRVLANIGTCQLYLGQLEDAKASYRSAISIAEATGQALVVAAAFQNLGCVDARLGNLEEAIAGLEHARQLYADMGDTTLRNLATLFEDLSETYRFAGLSREALRNARLAAWAVRDGDNVEKQTDADYQRARCLVDCGERSTARTLAQRVAAAYESADRPLQACHAELLILETIKPGDAVSDTLVQSGLRNAETLAEAGWTREALATRIRLAELLAASGDLEVAVACLPEDMAFGFEELSQESVEEAYGVALGRYLRGEPIDALLDATWLVLRDHRARLVDPELRLGAARMSERFRSLGLRDAARRHASFDALVAEERWRSLTWQLNQHEVENAEPKGPSLSASTLDDYLGDHGVLIEWAVADDDLYRIELSHDTSSIARCGSHADVMRQAALVRQSIARLLRPGLPVATASVFAHVLAETCAELGAVLGAQGHGPSLIACPPGGLIELPWRLLAEGPVQIVANCTSLIGPTSTIDRADAAVIVGPDLEYGSRDIASVDHVFPTAQVVQGADCTADALRGAFSTKSFVHIAAHGKFRTDNPRYSSIELRDGAVALHELEALDVVPAVVVLGICEAARAQAVAGDERRGSTTALLNNGTECVVAPICAVPDRELAAVFEAVYRELPGQTLHHALARAAPVAPGDDPRFWATAHATQCLGRAVAISTA